MRRESYPAGISWGMGGFRIGRSQYGRWWVSIALPFGVRLTRNLGTQFQDTILSNPEPKNDSFKNNVFSRSESTDLSDKDTKNQDILKKIREIKH